MVPRGDSPGPIPGAALLLTAYDVSDYLHSGANAVSIHVHSISHPAVLLADGLADLPDGRLWRFGTDSTWYAGARSKGGERSGVSSVTMLGNYGTAPWGPPIRVGPYSSDVPGEDIRAVALFLATSTITTVLIFLLWLLPISLLNREKHSLEAYWNTHSILHLPVVVVLLGILLISYDARVPCDWCYQPDILIAISAALIVGRLVFFLIPIANSGALRDHSAVVIRRLSWRWVALVLITAAGAVIRAWNLTAAPLGHDEVQMFLLSQSIKRVGFPYLVAGSYTRLLSTYELVPYPIAFSAAILVLRYWRIVCLHSYLVA